MSYSKYSEYSECVLSVLAECAEYLPAVRCLHSSTIIHFPLLTTPPPLPAPPRHATPCAPLVTLLIWSV